MAEQQPLAVGTAMEKVKICPHCQKEISAKADRCPFCQSDLMNADTHKYSALKILAALLPAIIFTQNWAWVSGNKINGWAFLVLWALIILNVWDAQNKARVLHRIFRTTEFAFLLLPASLIIGLLVVGSREIGSKTGFAEQAGTALGVGIGSFVFMSIALVIGITCGIIFHIIANGYKKKADIIIAEDTEINQGFLTKQKTFLTIVVLLGLVTAAANVGGSSDASSPAQTSEPPPSSDQTQTITRKSPPQAPSTYIPPPAAFVPPTSAQLDTKTQTLEGVYLTVNRPEEFISDGPDTYDQPKAGNKYISVHVLFDNESQKQVYYNQFDFKVVDPSGGRYDIGITTPKKSPELSSGTLNPSNRASGYITVEVPATVPTAQFIVHYESGGFLGGTTIDFK